MSVKINCANHPGLKEYAALAGESVSAVANEAINRWWETYGEVILDDLKSRDELKSRQKTNVLMFRPRPLEQEEGRMTRTL